MPISLSQFQRDVDLGRSDFPSLAFQIEMCRIQTDIALSCNDDSSEDDERLEIINQADSKICDFLRRVPRWKMDVGELFAHSYYPRGRESCNWLALPISILDMLFSRYISLTRHLFSQVDPDGRPDQVLFGAVAWAHM